MFYFNTITSLLGQSPVSNPTFVIREYAGDHTRDDCGWSCSKNHLGLSILRFTKLYQWQNGYTCLYTKTFYRKVEVAESRTGYVIYSKMDFWLHGTVLNAVTDVKNNQEID